MKSITSTLVLGVVFIVSCQNNTPEKSAKADSLITVKAADANLNLNECFKYIKNRDTSNLKLNSAGKIVIGNLSYRLFEKDKNESTIIGIIKGDTIIADYTFQSEGTKSIRQVVWLKKDDKLIEGFGDVEEADGKTKFKNISKLIFGKSIVFTKVECK